MFFIWELKDEKIERIKKTLLAGCKPVFARVSAVVCELKSFRKSRTKFLYISLKGFVIAKKISSCLEILASNKSLFPASFIGT